MTIKCACAVCNTMLSDTDEMRDHWVFKCGELSYIELAHVRCANLYNIERPGYWNTPEQSAKLAEMQNATERFEDEQREREIAEHAKLAASLNVDVKTLERWLNDA